MLRHHLENLRGRELDVDGGLATASVPGVLEVVSALSSIHEAGLVAAEVGKNLGGTVDEVLLVLSHVLLVQSLHLVRETASKALLSSGAVSHKALEVLIALLRQSLKLRLLGRGQPGDLGGAARLGSALRVHFGGMTEV